MALMYLKGFVRAIFFYLKRKGLQFYLEKKQFSSYNKDLKVLIYFSV